MSKKNHSQKKVKKSSVKKENLVKKETLVNLETVKLNMVNLPRNAGTYQVAGNLVKDKLNAFYRVNIPNEYQAVFSLKRVAGNGSLCAKLNEFPTNKIFQWKINANASNSVTQPGSWYLLVERTGTNFQYVLQIILQSRPVPTPTPVPTQTPVPVPTQTPVPTPTNGQGKKYALIVGISDYKTISDLSYCDEDATDWYQYLKGRGYEITVLGDNHPENFPVYDGLASEVNVRTKLKEILNKATSQDTVVFTTSGHGDGDGTGNSYLCLYSCDPSRDFDCYRDKELLADLQSAKERPKIFMFVDHCFSGGLLDEMQSMPNVACLTTCTKKGYGYDNAAQSNGAWTYCFLQKGLIEQFKGSAPVATVFNWAKTNYPTISGNKDAGDQPQMVNNLGDQFAI